MRILHEPKRDGRIVRALSGALALSAALLVLPSASAATEVTDASEAFAPRDPERESTELRKLRREIQRLRREQDDLRRRIDQMQRSTRRAPRARRVEPVEEVEVIETAPRRIGTVHRRVEGESDAPRSHRSSRSSRSGRGRARATTRVRSSGRGGDPDEIIEEIEEVDEGDGHARAHARSHGRSSSSHSQSDAGHGVTIDPDGDGVLILRHDGNVIELSKRGVSGLEAVSPGRVFRFDANGRVLEISEVEPGERRSDKKSGKRKGKGKGKAKGKGKGKSKGKAKAKDSYRIRDMVR